MLHVGSWIDIQQGHRRLGRGTYHPRRLADILNHDADEMVVREPTGRDDAHGEAAAGEVLMTEADLRALSSREAVFNIIC